MKKITILLGGQLEVTPRLMGQIAESTVIAADSGIRHAETLGVEPFLWLGDFDSTQEADFARYSELRRQSYPVEKDMTDGEIAVHVALAEGADEIILCGAFGGSRSDHALLHMTMAAAMAQKGIKILLTSGTEEGVPLAPGEYALDLPNDTLFSIIAFSQMSEFSIQGAQWQLQNAQLDFGSSLTLSNRVKGTLFVSFESGSGILIANLNE